MHDQLADGGDHAAAHPAGDLAHREDHLGGGHQRVAAAVHGRGPDLVGGALEVDVVPVQADDAARHADRDALALQARALLDVQLVVGVERAAGARGGAAVADARELVAEAEAVGVGARPGPVAVEGARPDAGGQHGGREPRPLLVGPVDELDGTERLDVVVPERAQHLQRAHHAEDTVEAAAAGLRVEVRPGDDRRERAVPSLPPAEDVPQLVDRHRRAELLEPRDEQVARPAVVVAQRETVHAAAGRSADLGHRLEAAPEALPVDPQLVAPRAHDAPVRTILPSLPPAAKRS